MARKLILFDTILRRYVSGVTTGPQTPLAGGLGAPMGGQHSEDLLKELANLCPI